MKHFIIGVMAVYIEDPIKVSRFVRYSIDSFLWEVKDMFLNDVGSSYCFSVSDTAYNSAIKISASNN